MIGFRLCQYFLRFFVGGVLYPQLVAAVHLGHSYDVNSVLLWRESVDTLGAGALHLGSAHMGAVPTTLDGIRSTTNLRKSCSRVSKLCISHAVRGGVVGPPRL